MSNGIALLNARDPALHLFNKDLTTVSYCLFPWKPLQGMWALCHFFQACRRKHRGSRSQSKYFLFILWDNAWVTMPVSAQLASAYAGVLVGCLGECYTKDQHCPEKTRCSSQRRR